MLSKEQRRTAKQEKKQYKSLAACEDKTTDRHSPVLLSVICVRFGNKYGREYVERLRNMVARNLSHPYEFACLTDDQHPIQGVIQIYQPNSNYQKGWWHKIHLFDSQLPLKQRIIYFDLDVVIHDKIDNLVYYEPTRLSGIRDFNRAFHSKWQYLNSSVMAWEHGTQNYIYQSFVKDKGMAMRLHGDQDWIWKTAKQNIVFWPESWIRSYKWEIRKRDEIQMIQGKRRFKNISHSRPSHDCCVLVFHGDPKPEDVEDPFIVEHWK